MSTPFSIDPAQVASAATGTAAGFNEIQQTLLNLNQLVLNLEGSFTGVGGQAVQQKFQQYQNLAKQLNETLSSLGKALGISGQRAEELQGEIVRMFNS